MGNMRAVFNRIFQDIRKFRTAALVFAVYNIVIRKIFGAFCPQLIITGFPCAGCGMTRAVFYILTSRFERGLRLNPAAVFWIVFLVWYGWNRYVRGIRPKNAMRWLGMVGVVTLLIYLYRMANFFPGDPPMVYYRNNIIRRLIRIYAGGQGPGQV